MLITDGPVPQPELSSFSPIYWVANDEALQRLGLGDEFLQERYCQLLAYSPGDSIYLKIDPDSRVHRVPQLPDLPKADQALEHYWHGQVYTDRGVTTTLGGGYLIHRRVIERLLEGAAWDGRVYDYTKKDGVQRLTVETTMGSYLNELGIYPTPWGEVDVPLYWRDHFRWTDKAITHPWKEINHPPLSP